MSALRRGSGDTHKFSERRAVNIYPQDKIYEETAFIGYYLHWDKDAVWEMTHAERRRWCDEISRINRRINDSSESPRDGNVFSLDGFR